MLQFLCIDDRGHLLQRAIAPIHDNHFNFMRGRKETKSAVTGHMLVSLDDLLAGNHPANC